VLRSNIKLRDSLINIIQRLWVNGYSIEKGETVVYPRKSGAEQMNISIEMSME
jgi:hypothetical protein